MYTLLYGLRRLNGNDEPHGKPLQAERVCILSSFYHGVPRMVSHMMMVSSARAPGVCNLRPEGLSRARCIMLRLAVYEAIPVGLDKLLSLSLPMSRTFFPELLSMTWLALNRLESHVPEQQ